MNLQAKSFPIYFLPNFRRAPFWPSLSFVFWICATASPMPTLAQTQYRLALVQAGASNFDEAVLHLKRQIGEDSTFTEAYVRLADYSRYAGSLPDANVFLKKAAIENPGNPNLALGQAVVASRLGDWPEVYEQAKDALENGSESCLAVRLLVDSAIEVGETDGLPKLLSRLRRRSSQSRLYDLGYAIWRLRIDNLRRARLTIRSYLNTQQDVFALKLQGDIERADGRFTSAISSYQKSLRVGDLDDRFSQLATMLSLASTYLETGHADSANFVFSAALDTARTLGALSEELQISLAFRDLLEMQGRYTEIASLCNKALSLAQLLRDDVARQRLYYYLGRAFSRMGNSNRAIVNFTRCAEADSFSTEPALRAQALGEIGALLLRRGRQLESGRYFSQGLQLAQQHGLADIEHQSLLALADLDRNRGDVPAAKTKYEKVLQYAQNTQRYDLIELSFTRLAFLYLRPNGNLDKAAYYLSLADALARQTLQPQFAATNRWMQGRIALLQEDVERAETYFLDAIQLGTGTGAYSAVLAGHAGLIDTYRRAGFADLALSRIDTTLAYLEEYGQLCLDETLLEYMDFGEYLFLPAIQALSAGGSVSSIFKVIESFKALKHFSALSDFRYTAGAVPTGSVPTAQVVIDDMITAKWRDIWKLWNRDRGDNSAAVASLKDDIAKMLTDRRTELANLEKVDSARAGLFRPSGGSIMSLRETLEKRKTIFLHYMLGRKSTHLLLVRPDSIFYKQIEVSRDQLTQMVKAVSPVFGTAWSGSPRGSFPLDIASTLYELLVEPVRPWFPRESKVIISADDVLHFLPFDCLVSNGRQLTDPYDYAAARFLVEDVNLSYAPSAKFLSWKSREPATWSHALAYFSRDETSATDRALNEVGRSRQVRQGRACTRNSFLTAAASSQVIDLADPVIVQPDAPLYSQLLGPNSEEESEALLVNEIFNLNLSSELVVIRSLEWARNTEQDWHALPALVHAWKCAGVPSVVAGLWKTGESSSQLIAGFYSNLKGGQDKSVALQRAKITFMNEVSRDPAEWGSYILYDDLQPMDLQSQSLDFVVGIAMIGSVALFAVLLLQFSRIRRDRSVPSGQR